VTKKKRLVLILDDLKEIHVLLENSLSKNGIEVQGVTNISELKVKLAEGIKPDAIVIDAYLPMDGKERGGVNAAAIIRKDKQFVNVPILFYSNYTVYIKANKDTVENWARVRSLLGGLDIKEENIVDKNFEINSKGEQIINIETVDVLADKIIKAIK